MFWIVCDPSSGSTELCLTEITRGGSQILFVCLVGVWQRNFEPVVCARYDGLGQPVVPCTHTHTDHSRGEFRPRQTRQLPRAVDLKGRLLSCQSY